MGESYFQHDLEMCFQVNEIYIFSGNTFIYRPRGSRLAGKKWDEFQFLGSIAHGNGDLIVAELTLRLQEDKVDCEYSKTSQRLL